MSICVFKKQDCSGLWLMRATRGNQNGARLPERFTVRIRMNETFGKF